MNINLLLMEIEIVITMNGLKFSQKFIPYFQNFCNTKSLISNKHEKKIQTLICFFIYKKYLKRIVLNRYSHTYTNYLPNKDINEIMFLTFTIQNIPKSFYILFQLLILNLLCISHLILIFQMFLLSIIHNVSHNQALDYCPFVY